LSFVGFQTRFDTPSRSLQKCCTLRYHTYIRPRVKVHSIGSSFCTYTMFIRFNITPPPPPFEYPKLCDNFKNKMKEVRYDSRYVHHDNNYAIRLRVRFYYNRIRMHTNDDTTCRRALRVHYFTVTIITSRLCCLAKCLLIVSVRISVQYTQRTQIYPKVRDGIIFGNIFRIYGFTKTSFRQYIHDLLAVTFIP